MMTRPLRILVADDLEVNLELTSLLLEKKGHTVVAARNGREAVAAFEREVFDVVLMDVEMPQMDGIEATREIRKLEQASGRHIRIVALTGHATPRDHERLLAAGMDAHITKPFEVAALWGILEGGGGQPATLSPAAAAQVGFEEALLARVGGNRKLLGTLIRLFKAECPRKLKETRKAVSARDARALAGAAHAVKGLVGNFGAQPALAAARELEAMGWNGELTGADAALARLEKEVATLETALAGLGAQLAAKMPRKIQRRKK